MAGASLADILGHEQAKATLQAAMASERVHHAWIFQGAAGVGKRTAAEAFGATLLDPTTGPTLAGDLAPDPASQTQGLIAAGLHPDLHIITKELAKFSDDAAIRERKLISIPRDVIDTHLLEPAARAASMTTGARASKVFIVDEAELLNAQTQNALLKTLEEPPLGTVIILVTSTPETLLPTIRSRCQRVTFGPLSDADMKKWLKGWLAGRKEKPGKEETEWALDHAAGAPGVAALAIEGGLFGWQERLAPMLALVERGEYVADFGPEMHRCVDEWAKEFVDRRWKERRENASKDAANRAGAERMFSFLGERARRRLRKAGADDLAGALRAIDLVAVAERRLESNVNLALVLENLAAQIARGTRGPDPRFADVV